jgi:hypothetical protein
MADVERCAGLHDAAVVSEGGREKPAELLVGHPVALDGQPVLGIAFVIYVVGRVCENQVGGMPSNSLVTSAWFVASPTRSV